MTNLTRRLAAVSATLLLTFAASCSSDDSSDDTSPASVETSTADSTADSIVGSDTTAAGGDAPDTTLDASGTDTVADRAAIVNFLFGQAASAGVEVDSQCVLDIVARLSDADAKLLGDSARAGGTDSPELSAEGDALGDELNGCEAVPITTGS